MAARMISTDHHTVELDSMQMAYELACRNVKDICSSEKTRQLHLASILLQNEILGMNAQLSQGDRRIKDLEKLLRISRDDLKAATRSSESARIELRVRAREIKNLKAELSSLENVTMDSTKLLTEKLTLNRELSSLLPELEYLRSQALSNQALLTEKLSLQRQVCTLQVELESEKSLVQRTTYNAVESNVRDVKIESQLGEALAELQREKRDKQHAVGEAGKRYEQMQRRVTILESRLAASNDKFKSTKDSLKETQMGLKKAQQVRIDQKVGPLPVDKLAIKSRKRVYEDMDTSSRIGTPGDLPTAKNSKPRRTVPGEKSTFSVTPFLTHTRSVCLDYSEGDVHGDGHGPETKEAASPTAGAMIPTTFAPVARAEPLEEESTICWGTIRSKPKREIAWKSRPPIQSAPKLASVPELDKVAEERDLDAARPHAKDMMPLHAGSLADEAINLGAMVVQKKRRLLGQAFDKSILDDEDADVIQEPRKLSEGRTFLDVGKRARLGLKNRHVAMEGFGTISPLKRDRR